MWRLVVAVADEMGITLPESNRLYSDYSKNPSVYKCYVKNVDNDRLRRATEAYIYKVLNGTLSPYFAELKGECFNEDNELVGLILENAGSELDSTAKGRHAKFTSMPIMVVESIKGLWKAVSQIHECGIAHLDIKQKNLLINPIGQVRLIDFTHSYVVANRPRAKYLNYLEEMFGEDHPTEGNFKATSGNKVAYHRVHGSRETMAPEIQQANIDVSIDPKAVDVYAAGIVTFQLLTANQGTPITARGKTIISHSLHFPPEARKLEDIISHCFLEHDERPDASTVSAQIDELGDELIQIVLATQELRASGRIKYQGKTNSEPKRARVSN
eukprot:TRINITY_DN2148_c0_g1_i1.p1 TRINITY_DN2148_c0_g1~~TRINITY_DN2148_c0_g1_i1.p1  ORF type:complete len:378 (+),score=25.43 TRINITY_DN2148_c0_g1_i1:152-1135(+)